MEAPRKRLPAAQYVRMSTEKQIYSAGHQAAAIATYAQQHGFEIVCTYQDNGRSGLHLKGRAGLQQMLADILSRKPGFDAVLVYDVSRWGRFQDTDESAHYEFICRSAGVQIHYCAELFDNDGSLTSAILKNLKRVMAGEYSRELSTKVWLAQSRHAALGYRMGGRTPYGLRRVLLDAEGVVKMELRPGEVKNIRSEKVILVPGPPEELATIRRIYRLSIRCGQCDEEIATLLNAEKVLAVMGGRWSKFLIRQVLTSEIYTGTALFNRTSSKMGGRAVRNPAAQWIRREQVFLPIISRKLFLEAQRARHNRRSFRLSEEELLEPLRRLFTEHRKLSLPLITQTAGMPNAQTYRRRYGSLDAAYARVGYHRPHNRPSPSSSKLVDRAATFATQVENILRRSGLSLHGGALSGVVSINRRIRLATALAQHCAGARDRFWEVRINRAYQADYVFAGLMAADGRNIGAYYLLPAARFPACGTIRILEGGHRLEPYRIPDIISLGINLRDRLTELTRPAT